MVKIPPALDSDTDDVAWALQTANTLWERGEQQDALSWLRRAAQAAGEADDDTRAFALARAAAEIVELVEGESAAPPPPDPAAVSSPPFDAEESPSIDAQIAASAVEPPSFDAEPAEESPRLSMDVDISSLRGTEVASTGEDEDEEVVTSAPPLKLLDRTRQDDDIAQILVSPSAPRAASPSNPMLDAGQFDKGLPPVPPVAEPTMSSEAEPVGPPAVPIPPPPPPADTSAPNQSPPAMDAELPDSGLEDVTQMLAEAAVEPPPEPVPPPPRAPEPSLVELEPLSLHPESIDEANQTSATAKAPPPPPKLAPPPPPKLAPPPPPKLAPPTPAVPAVETAAELAAEPEPAAEPETTAPEPAVSAVAPEPAAERVLTESSGMDEAREGPSAPSDEPSSAHGEPEPEQESPTYPTEFVVPPPPPTVERGLRTRRPSQLPRRGTKPPPLEFDEPLVPEGSAAFPVSSLSEPEPGTEPAPEAAPEPAPEPEPDLSDVEDFADMTDETRRAFERQAVVFKLRTDEEVSQFGLAWVVEGQVAVMGIVSDTPAVRLDEGAVLRSRGTVDACVPLRLVCTSETAKVAVWSDEDVARSFEALPWVEDELRENADRAHALIGVTLGPLGEAFGQIMLEEITPRLVLRHYVEGESIVEAGEPLPGLLILGVGKLEVLDAGGDVSASLDVGTILFPNALLTMEDAPATARAGEGGAVVLMADRTTAQEIIITFPPLLEQLTRG